MFAYAAAQVKKAMEVTKRLGGENYVFWGGREGYHNLLNTDLKLAPCLTLNPISVSFGEADRHTTTCSTRTSS